MRAVARRDDSLPPHWWRTPFVFAWNPTAGAAALDVEDILASEEEHVDFLETQFDMIARMGLENYVQLNSKPVGEGEAG